MSYSIPGLISPIERAASDLGWESPTEIQSAAIPPALAGRDVIACAMTGSGKTAAFVLPILQRLSSNRRRRGIGALVITPTRELALQVEEQFRLLGRHTGLRSVAVFGGVKPAPQERALRRGVDVVVATPGRLLDHMRQPWLRFDALEVLVLDEADRMLDMGFLPDVRRILEAVPSRRQTLLFSATMPRPIVRLARELLSDPVRLDVERPSAPAAGVRQTILPVEEGQKPGLLLAMLESGRIETALVFTRTKHRANRLARYLGERGVPCERIHGNRTQPQRQAALRAFKDGRVRVLVATDIAARGIDIAALPHVVNFDVPHLADDYIHRVGRTARGEATGDALTLATPADRREIAAIERMVGRRLPRVQAKEFDYRSAPAQGGPAGRSASPRPGSRRPRRAR